MYLIYCTTRAILFYHQPRKLLGEFSCILEASKVVSSSLISISYKNMSDTDLNHIFTTHHHHHYHHAPPKQNTKILSVFLKSIVMFLILSFSLIFIGLAAILFLLAATFIHRRRRHTTANPPPLHHLPSFQYSSQKDVSHDCSICLEGFEDGDMCRAMQVCDHFFHAQCVDTWLVKVPSCPICRRVVRLEDDRMSGDEECRFLWAIGVGRQVDLGW